MSINSDRINSIIDERSAISPNNELAIINKQQELFEALGNDEKKVIEILSSADEDKLVYFSEIFEDIYRKFTTEKMWNFLGELERKIK